MSVGVTRAGIAPGRAGGIEPWVATNYYSASGTTGTAVQTADRLIAVKLDVPPGSALDRIGVEATTPGTGSEVLRYGVARPTGGLTAEVIHGISTPLTAAATGPAGFKEVTTSYSFGAGGTFYALFVTQVVTTSVTLRTIAGVNTRYAQGSSTVVIAQCYYQDGITGALPATLALAPLGAAAGLVKVRAA